MVETLKWFCIAHRLADPFSVTSKSRRSFEDGRFHPNPYYLYSRYYLTDIECQEGLNDSLSNTQALFLFTKHYFSLQANSNKPNPSSLYLLYYLTDIECQAKLNDFLSKVQTFNFSAPNTLSLTKWIQIINFPPKPSLSLFTILSIWYIMPSGINIFIQKKIIGMNWLQIHEQMHQGNWIS